MVSPGTLCKHWSHAFKIPEPPNFTEFCPQCWFQFLHTNYDQQTGDRPSRSCIWTQTSMQVKFGHFGSVVRSTDSDSLVLVVMGSIPGSGDYSHILFSPHEHLSIFKQYNISEVFRIFYYNYQLWYNFWKNETMYLFFSSTNSTQNPLLYS